jgi:hypothetical protein
MGCRFSADNFEPHLVVHAVKGRLTLAGGSGPPMSFAVPPTSRWGWDGRAMQLLRLPDDALLDEVEACSSVRVGWLAWQDATVWKLYRDTPLDGRSGKLVLGGTAVECPPDMWMLDVLATKRNATVLAIALRRVGGGC